MVVLTMLLQVQGGHKPKRWATPGQLCAQGFKGFSLEQSFLSRTMRKEENPRAATPMLPGFPH